MRLPHPNAQRRGGSPERHASYLLAVAAALVLAGCADLSGLGASSTFKCNAPPGLPCRSLAAVDAAQRSGSHAPSAQEPDGSRATPAGAPARTAMAEIDTPTQGAVAAVGTGAQERSAARPALQLMPTGALRSEPTVVRMWVAPWVDRDGDLHDQGHVYLQVDTGRWLIDHNRERIRRAFAPQAAGGASTSAVPAEADAQASPKPAARSPMAAASRPTFGAPRPAANPPQPQPGAPR